MKKLLICEPEEKVREGLKSLLNNDYEMILCDTIEQALFTLENAKDIGLLILNVCTPKEFSSATIKKFREKYPKLPIIALSEKIPSAPTNDNVITIKKSSGKEDLHRMIKAKFS